MKKAAGRALSVAAAAGMLCLIFDSRHGAAYAARALELCLQTVIPSLFPMFVFSGLLVGSMGPGKGRFLPAVERFLGLPSGCGPLFLLGFVGGFPVGAQCIAQAVEAKALSRPDARRLLGLCNHCSPGFLFGILGSVFTGSRYPLLVFLIQLESALICAVLWSRESSGEVHWQPGTISLSQAVARGIRSMTTVCAWVILAGVVTGFLERWLLPFLPDALGMALTGLLELTSGVLSLARLSSEETRLILCCVFVCFGGVSVMLQIQSIASEKGIGCGLCLRQKCLQGLLGGLLAVLLIRFGPVCPILLGAAAVFLKKEVEILRRGVYNSSHKGGI